MTDAERNQRITELKEELKQLRSTLPMHGVKPQTEFQMMELEDEIVELRQGMAVDGS
jgi:hypothetical protein